MEKSLDATATTTTSVDSQTAQPPLTFSQPSSMASQTSGPSFTPFLASAFASLSPGEILDQALQIITFNADSSLLSEDELLAASMLFINISADVVRIKQTFIALSNTLAVQHHFILRQLKDNGYLQGKISKERGRAKLEEMMMIFK